MLTKLKDKDNSKQKNNTAQLFLQTKFVSLSYLKWTDGDQNQLKEDKEGLPVQKTQNTSDTGQMKNY